MFAPLTPIQLKLAKKLRLGSPYMLINKPETASSHQLGASGHPWCSHFQLADSPEESNLVNASCKIKAKQNIKGRRKPRLAHTNPSSEMSISW